MTAIEPTEDQHYPEEMLERLLASPPILPHEDPKGFQAFFDEFVLYAEPVTTPDLLEVYLVTVLNWEIFRYHNMKIAILRNNYRAAVERLIRLTHDAGPVHMEAAGVRADAHIKAEQWFADDAYRAVMTKKLSAAGYGPNAVEAEAFSRALPLLASIERLQASAEKRLATLLKSIEKRSEARAAALRLAASKITTKPSAGTAG